MGSALVVLFHFMLILWCIGHDVSDGIPFFSMFCISLDKCHVMIHGMSNFPFVSELFCLFLRGFKR